MRKITISKKIEQIKNLEKENKDIMKKLLSVVLRNEKKINNLKAEIRKEVLKFTIGSNKLTLREIGEIIGISHETVRQWLLDMGIKLSKRKIKQKYERNSR